MKNFFLIAVLMSAISSTSAACLDFSTNLSRGARSPTVLALQQFLASKQFLTATPNGYFGLGTLAAVKEYQKSVGLSQVGNIGPATRAAIKKDSCGISVQTSPQQSRYATTTLLTSTTPHATPTLSRVDLVTLFAGGTRDWSPIVYGTGFASTSNSIYFRDQSSSRRYLVGAVPSPDGVTLAIPSDITIKKLSCGSGCNEMLQPGNYDVSVVSNGLESNTVYMSIKGFNSSVRSGTDFLSILSNAKGARIGSVVFSSQVAVQIVSVTPTITSDGIMPTGTTLKDDITGITPPFSSDTSLDPNQSKLIGVYGDFDDLTSGRLTTTFSITVMDFLGKKNTTFTTAPFLATVVPYQ
jgi:hypothetical protein